jgi:hypothetical protein
VLPACKQLISRPGRRAPLGTRLGFDHNRSLVATLFSVALCARFYQQPAATPITLHRVVNGSTTFRTTNVLENHKKHSLFRKKLQSKGRKQQSTYLVQATTQLGRLNQLELILGDRLRLFNRPRRFLLLDLFLASHCLFLHLLNLCICK